MKVHFLKLIFLFLFLNYSYLIINAQTVEKVIVTNAGCPEINGTYNSLNLNGNTTDIFEHTDQANSPYEIGNAFGFFWTIRNSSSGANQIGPYLDPVSSQSQPSAGTWGNSSNVITCEDGTTMSNASNPTVTVCVLPVQLTLFRANYINDYVELIWQTASEENNKGFEIEYSPNGQDWESIGFEEGNGNSYEVIDYAFVHEKPRAVNNYYRLKQIDFTGVFEYSPVQIVQITSKDDLIVYPNPTSFDVSIQLPEEALSKNIEIYIHDIDGKMVRNFNFFAEGNTLDVSFSDLPAGIYALSLRNNQVVWQKKITKL